MKTLEHRWKELYGQIEQYERDIDQSLIDDELNDLTNFHENHQRWLNALSPSTSLSELQVCWSSSRSRRSTNNYQVLPFVFFLVFRINRTSNSCVFLINKRRIIERWDWSYQRWDKNDKENIPDNRTRPSLSPALFLSRLLRLPSDKNTSSEICLTVSSFVFSLLSFSFSFSSARKKNRSIKQPQPQEQH